MNVQIIKYKEFKSSEELENFQRTRKYSIIQLALFENGTCAATYLDVNENAATEAQAFDLVIAFLARHGMLKEGGQLRNMYQKGLAQDVAKNSGLQI